MVDRGITRFAYTYDFCDDWRHTVTIEATAAADPVLDYPRLGKGERQAPPEDVGGIPEFEAFLDIMTKPRHRERKRLLEWYGGPFDPDVLDMTTIKRRIGKLARRRAIGKAAFLKSRKERLER